MQTRQYLISEMTWPEVETARQAAPLAIIPTGSCEQHGPHLALETDSVRANEMAKRIAERLAPRAVVTPCLTIAVSEHHMDFPGTLSLSPLTFQQVLYEVIGSLAHHGWRKVFVLNGHGGNEAAIGIAAARAQTEFRGLLVATSGITPLVQDLARKLATSPRTGHACEIETSQTLYLAPQSVRVDRLEAARFLDTELPQTGVNAVGRVRLAKRFSEITANGALGDARQSSAAMGQELIEEALARVCCFLEAFIRESPD